MIGDWLGASLRGIPLAPDPAKYLVVWLFALIIFVLGLSGAGLLVAGEARRDAEHTLAATMGVTVPADTSAARLETVLALLRQTGAFASAIVVPAVETKRLLEPWLGSAAQIDELPVPKLIELRTDPAKAIDLAALRKQLATVMPDAQFDDHRQQLGDLRRGARRIEIVLAAAVSAALLAAVAAAISATRNDMATDRSLIELAHLLGAADRDIALPFAMRALLTALAGGAIGGVAIMATIAGLAGAGGIVRLSAPITTGLGDWRLWLIALLAALATALIASASAYMIAWRRLAALP